MTADGDAVYRLIETCKPLDINSRYTYLLLCDHFRGTCIVAESDKKVCGFVSGYVHPRKENTLFIWQVAVRPDIRGKGIALSMIGQLLKRPHLMNISYVEATAIQSNIISFKLFRSYADKMKAQCFETRYFPVHLFGGDAHEEEILFKIGPLYHQ